MAQQDDFDQKLLQTVLASHKDKLTVGDYVKMVRLREEVKMGRLLTQISQFLMVIIASTFVLLALHSTGLVHLPSTIVDKLAILFGAEIVALLGVIVRYLTKAKEAE